MIQTIDEASAEVEAARQLLADVDTDSAQVRILCAEAVRSCLRPVKDFTSNLEGQHLVDPIEEAISSCSSVIHDDGCATRFAEMQHRVRRAAKLIDAVATHAETKAEAV